MKKKNWENKYKTKYEKSLIERNLQKFKKKTVEENTKEMIILKNTKKDKKQTNEGFEGVYVKF